MVVLRPTSKASRGLTLTGPAPHASTGALGDWYINRLTVDRQPLLILVSSTSLLPLLIPARNAATLPDRLPAIVAGRLERLGVPRAIIDAEIATHSPVLVDRTTSRSVVGTMVDFGFAVPYHLPVGQWNEATLERVEVQIGETPSRDPVTRRPTLWPNRDAVRLLHERWAGSAGPPILRLVRD